MRLGLVGPLPPPPGGMANQTRQLSRLLAAEGVEVTIARTNAPYAPAWIGSLRGIRALARLLPYRRKLAALARESDVMHVMANSGWAWFLFAAPAIRAAARRGVPVIVNYRGGLAREFLARHARSVRSTLRAAGVLVVPSRFLQEVFAGYGLSARIIPNVVDIERFRGRAQQNRALQDRVGAGNHVVIVRNLEAIYGVDTAIRAFAAMRNHLPASTLSVAGSGPERPTLERLASELGVSDAIRFTGRLEVAEVAALYASADVALNPSRADNMPNSLLEAAASGVPIVSTNVGGVPHLVEHGVSAWLVPPDDPQQMAQGLARVLQDEALRNRLRHHASELARRCSWSEVGPQWLQLYGELAAGKGPVHRRARGGTSGVYPVL